MKLSHILIASAALGFVSAPVLADEAEEYRNTVSTFITLQGHACGSVLTVEQREEPNAFNVTCALNADGSGTKVNYFFQLGAEGVVVEPQDN